MSTSGVRWAILGTANIARAQFLPALREAGGGRAALVAGRDLARAGTWAADHGVDAAVAGYQAAVGSPDIDAIYIPLPNSLHAGWITRALEAGKAVLCEKPLCANPTEAAAVIEVSRRTGSLLWEAFVFPFQDQHTRLVEVIRSGEIGEVSEVVSAFHFPLSQPTNIRLSADLAGGALLDVGCYPVRLAQELLGPAPPDAEVVGTGTGNGEVETDAAAVAAWPGGRLVLTCGFARAYDTFTTVAGTEGRVQLTNPFHPKVADTLTVLRSGRDPRVERPTNDAHTFTAALRHIHAVLAGEEAPRHLATDDSLPTALLLDRMITVCRPS